MKIAQPPNRRQTMPQTSSDYSCEVLRERIDRLAQNTSIPSSFTNALLSLLAAVEYDDKELMRAAVQNALEECQQVVSEDIQNRLALAAETKEACDKVRRVIENHPAEDWDQLGQAVERAIDATLGALTAIMDGPVKLLKQHNHEVEKEAVLKAGIQELQALKQEVLGDWPWSDRELPPVNWDMVAASRAAFARNECESLSALIARLGGSPDQGGKKEP